jgi:hypothetical protein
LVRVGLNQPDINTILIGRFEQGREADAEPIGSDRVGDGRDDLSQEPQPVL